MSVSTATSTTSHQRSSRRRSTLIKGSTNPWSESSSASIHQTQGESLSETRSIELLLDPVGHRHLEDPDSEIIDRALALKIASRQDVYILTGDGNMQFVADVAGLKVASLPD